MDQPLKTHPGLPEFDQFIRQFETDLRARCQRGAETYGDKSFDKPLPQGLDEIMQELIDVAGWAWCQWVRLARIKLEVTETGEKP